jgi:hypothetical protein
MFVAAGDSLSSSLLVRAAPPGEANRRGFGTGRGTARDCDGDGDGDRAGGGGRDDARVARLAAVAEQVRAIQARHRPAGERHATGLAALDALLGGGFAQSAIHELVAGKEAAAVDAVAWRAASAAAGAPCGTMATRASEAASIDAQRASIPDQARGLGAVTAPPHLITSSPAHAAFTAQRWLVYIDSAASLFPPALAAIGVPLERLLVVRVSRATDVLWTFEQCLRCRAVAAVIAPLRELDAYVSRRLQLAAEQGSSLGFVLRPDVPIGHTFAATRLRFDPIPGDGGPASGRSFAIRESFSRERPAGGRSPGTFFIERGFYQARVRRLRVTPLKLRDGGVREPVIVELCDAAHAVSMDAVPVDRASVARLDQRDAVQRRAIS